MNRRLDLWFHRGIPVQTTVYAEDMADVVAATGG